MLHMLAYEETATLYSKFVALPFYFTFYFHTEIVFIFSTGIVCHHPPLFIDMIFAS